MCFCAGLYLGYEIFHRLNSAERILVSLLQQTDKQVYYRGYLMQEYSTCPKKAHRMSKNALKLFFRIMRCTRMLKHLSALKTFLFCAEQTC